MGGAEGGAGLAAGLVGGEELLDFNGSAAGNVGFGHHPTKSDLNDRVNHGVSRSLTLYPSTGSQFPVSAEEIWRGAGGVRKYASKHFMATMFYTNGCWRSEH